MKRLLLLVLLTQLLASSLHAQKIEIKINKGINLTYIPDFYSDIFIANDGMVVPGLINISNSHTLILTTSLYETTTRLGLFFDLELGVKLTERLKLLFSTGILQMKYSYNTIVHAENTPTIDLGSLSKDYGNTNLIYVNLQPIGISYGFLNNKINLQSGVLFNILIKSKYYNTVILYSNNNNGSQTYDNIDKVYFESIGNMNKILYGVNLRASYKIINNLDIFISGQYYFNSIYHFKKRQETYQTLHDCNPFILETGVSWTICNCGN